MKSKEELYFNAYSRTLIELAEDLKHSNEFNKALLKKSIVYGVKLVINSDKEKDITVEEAQINLQLCECVNQFIGRLTPDEFTQLFPISKEYNGDKYEIMDYYYTCEYLKTINTKEPIGEAFSFLCEYHNREIRKFIVKYMNNISNVRVFNGEMGLMEQFAEDNNIKTYRKFKDNKGQEYMIDTDTNKYIKIKKARPRYLRVLRNNRVV